MYALHSKSLHFQAPLFPLATRKALEAQRELSFIDRRASETPCMPNDSGHNEGKHFYADRSCLIAVMSAER